MMRLLLTALALSLAGCGPQETTGPATNAAAEKPTPPPAQPPASPPAPASPEKITQELRELIGPDAGTYQIISGFAANDSTQRRLYRLNTKTGEVHELAHVLIPTKQFGNRPENILAKGWLSIPADLSAEIDHVKKLAAEPPAPAKQTKPLAEMTLEELAALEKTILASESK